MKNRMFIILVTIILIISYIDLLDSCKRIDTAIDYAAKCKSFNVVKSIKYTDLLKTIYD